MSPTVNGEAWRRCAVVAIGTAAVTAGIMFGVTLVPFQHRERPIPETVTIEAGLVELPTPPQPTSPAAERPPTPAAPPQSEPEPQSVPIKPPAKRAVQKSKPRPTDIPAAPSRPQPADAAAPAALAHEEQPSGGTGGARAIFQPSPVIPSELRRHAMNFVAVVRFSIAGDGSASAELVEATPVPELNQVLLDTFRRWRFFPAMQNGMPVSSTLVLKVPVRVE